MLTDHPELFDGMRLVPCAVMTDNDNPQAGWLFIPHADGKWVSAAKLQPFSQQIINYWWNRPSSAEVLAAPQPPSPFQKRPYNGRAMSVQDHNEIVDALLAKVAEQSAEIERLNRGIEVYMVQFELECQTTDRQSALIKELTETRDALWETQRALCNQVYERDMLIEKCERVLRDLTGMGFADMTLAAIAAHRSKP